MNPYESPPQAAAIEPLRGVPPEVEVEYELTFDDLASYSWELMQRQRFWFDLTVLLTVAALIALDLWPARRAILRDPARLLEFDLFAKIVAALLTAAIGLGLVRLAYRLGLVRRLSALVNYATASLVGKSRDHGIHPSQARPAC